MTAWSRVLYRVLAAGCVWAAACLWAAAFAHHGWLGGYWRFVAGCLLLGVGVGLWRGER